MKTFLKELCHIVANVQFSCSYSTRVTNETFGAYRMNTVKSGRIKDYSDGVFHHFSLFILLRCFTAFTFMI